MNLRQIQLVQDTFNQVEPIADVAADLFYQRLFELDPALRVLFKDDLLAQKRMLMQTLGGAVRGLTQLEALIPVVQSLGRRHRGYGVESQHYATVGAALLWTLEQGLGTAYTADVAEAWSAAYALLASVMQEAPEAAEAA